MPRRTYAVTTDVPTSLLMEEFALGTGPNERLVIMRAVRAMQRKEGFVSDTERGGRLVAMRDVTTMQRKEECVLGTGQRLRFTFAVMKDVQI